MSLSKPASQPPLTDGMTILGSMLTILEAEMDSESSSIVWGLTLVRTELADALRRCREAVVEKEALEEALKRQGMEVFKRPDSEMLERQGSEVPPTGTMAILDGLLRILEAQMDPRSSNFVWGLNLVRAELGEALISATEAIAEKEALEARVEELFKRSDSELPLEYQETKMEPEETSSKVPQKAGTQDSTIVLSVEDSLLMDVDLKVKTYDKSALKDVFLCPKSVCNRACRSRHSLARHLIRAHELTQEEAELWQWRAVAIKVFACPWSDCRLRASTQRDLRDHLRVHHFEEIPEPACFEGFGDLHQVKGFGDAALPFKPTGWEEEKAAAGSSSRRAEEQEEERPSETVSEETGCGGGDFKEDCGWKGFESLGQLEAF